MSQLKLRSFAGAILALALCVTGASLAQTTTSVDVRNFEVISVNGNTIVVRDQTGTNEYNVPADFRFMVNGKPTAANELQVGMKGTATITKTTTVRHVYVTTVKTGKVLDQTARTIVIKEDNGIVHRFTQTEADARGVSFYLEGKPAKIADFQRGDIVTATIITSGPPETLTSQQVDAVLGAAEPVAAAAAPAEEGAAPAAEAPAAAPTPEPQAAMEQAAPAAAATEEATTAPALPKPYTKNPIFWLFVLIIVVALIWVLMRRKVKK